MSTVSVAALGGIGSALADYLAQELRVPVTIERAHRVAMGQSRAMYVVDATIGGQPRRLVARVEQSGLLGSASHDEVGIMRALHRVGFPVAEIVAYEPSGEVLGQPFFVMAFVPGVSTHDPATVDDYLRLLGQLHDMDPVAVAGDVYAVPSGPTGAALAQVDRWEATYRSGLIGAPSPLIEEAIAWLRIHAPATERVCLVHADPGPGNYLHEHGRITALVDWEFTHIGDEYDDWAYLIYMRGRHHLGEAEWIERIRAVLGIELDRERLRYWRAVKHLMGAAIDQTAMRLYVQRVERAPNLLAIGTGVHLSALRRLYDVALA